MSEKESMENYDYEKDFHNKFNEEMKLYKRPNILICGYTGAGKTSIIQALFGKDMVPDYKIKDAEPGTMDYEMYENELLRIWDSKGLEPDKGEHDFIETTRAFIRERQDISNNVDDHIHIFWYVISAGIERITPTDLKIINIFPKESTIVVISKKDKDNRGKTIEAYKKKLIKDGNISEDRIICTADLDVGDGRVGIHELYEKSLEILPEAYKSAFQEAQRIDIEKAVDKVKEKKSKANGIIVSATAAAGATAAVPIPLSDSLVITPIQIGMVASLAALYSLNKEQLQHQALPLVARTVGMITASSLAKLIPGLGSAINSTVAVFITGALGWFVQNQFEKMAIAKVRGEPAPTINFDFSLFSEFLNNYKKNNKDE